MLEKSLSVCVLAFNEERTVAKCLAETLAACRTVPGDFEIVLVNDGSTDRTLEFALEFAKLNPKIRVVSNKVNAGYGGAFRRGALEARMNYCTMVGAVNAIDQNSLAEIFSHVGEKDMVLSYIANLHVRPRFRQIVSNVYRKGVNILFGYNIESFHGCNIYPTAQIRNRKYSNSHAFLVEILIGLLDMNLSYVMVPMVLQPRLVEHSSALKIRNVIKVVYALSRLFVLRLFRSKLVPFQKAQEKDGFTATPSRS